MLTRKLSIVLPGVVAFVWAIQPPVGQVHRVLGLAGDKSGLRLSLAASESSYHVGAPILLRAEFRNVGEAPARIAVGSPSELFFRFSEVRIEGPNSASPAQLTPFGKERTDATRMLGTKFRMLQQDGAVGESFDGAVVRDTARHVQNRILRRYAHR